MLSVCRLHFKWPNSEVCEIMDAVSHDSRDSQFTHGDPYIVLTHTLSILCKLDLKVKKKNNNNNMKLEKRFQD